MVLILLPMGIVSRNILHLGKVVLFSSYQATNSSWYLCMISADDIVDESGSQLNRKARCFGSYKYSVHESTNVRIGDLDVRANHENVVA